MREKCEEKKHGSAEIFSEPHETDSSVFAVQFWSKKVQVDPGSFIVGYARWGLKGVSTQKGRTHAWVTILVTSRMSCMVKKYVVI